MQAEHDDSGTPVAIRYLSAKLLEDEDFRERFEEQARLLERLREPGLVAVHEYVESPHGAAIIMELVDGVSLAQLMNADGALGPEASLVVLKGALHALAVVHQAGLVHGDYKPGNILVDGDGYTRLTDFGLAMRADEMPVPGTPAYLAPELWKGEPPTPASDIYAAAAVFYECLTGREPYGARTLSQLALVHRTGVIPVVDVPELLRPLVRHGLDKQPEDRPESATEYLTELEAIAFAAYGVGWEERGRAVLKERAAELAMLFPIARDPGVLSAQAAPDPEVVPYDQDFYGDEEPKTRTKGAILAISALVAAAVVGFAFIYGTGGGSNVSAAAPEVSRSPQAAASDESPDPTSPVASPTDSPSPSPTKTSKSPSPSPTKTAKATPDKTSARPTPTPFQVTGVTINVSRKRGSNNGSYTVSVSDVGQPKGSVTLTLSFSGATDNGSASKTVTLSAGGGYTASGTLTGSHCSAWTGSVTTSPGGKSGSDTVPGDGGFCL
jgi:serine/threonine protein kinase